MKVVFSGGGTMGSVVPLLAVAEALKDKYPDVDYYWLGTKDGPEVKVIKNYNIEFKAILAGKWRRYFSGQNFLDVLKIMVGFFQAMMMLIKWRPDVIVSAGGYVAVPVVWAGWLLGVPSLIHQQDVRPGLANKLCAGCANKITVCFESSVKYFKLSKTVVVGNPVRELLKQREAEEIKQEVSEKYGLKKDLPIVLIMGGGTGSSALNKLVISSLDELTKFSQIVHISGGRINNINLQELDIENYYHYEFLVDNTELLQAADVVVSRAGMGSLTEIAYLSKPAIIIPIPNSHQEDNADYFFQRGAVIKIDQSELNKDKFIAAVKELLINRQQAKRLSQTVHGVIKWGTEERIAEMIIKLAAKNNYI